MSESKDIPLLSATGSTRMGRIVAEKVGARLGKTLLELGGNNAIIVTPDADLKMTIMGTVFGAVGTCGQRCTSTRRLIVHEKVYDKVKNSLVKAYNQIKIGNPLDSNIHVGPLIDLDAVKSYEKALYQIKKEGGSFLIKGGVLSGKEYISGCYVKPAIAEVNHSLKIVHTETFAPILYLIKYSGDIENAIEIQNEVDQGLSSSVMTNSLKDMIRIANSDPKLWAQILNENKTNIIELIDIFQSEIEYVKEVLTSSNSGIKKTEDLLEASQWHDENFKSK